MTDVAPAPKIATSATPIGDSLQKHLDDVLAQIPSGRTGTIGLGVSTTGAVISASAKKAWRGLDLTGTGYAGKVWHGSGWEAGVRGAIVF